MKNCNIQRGISANLWNNHCYRLHATLLTRWLCMLLVLPLSIGQVSELPQNCPDLGRVQQVFCGSPVRSSDCTLAVWVCDGRTDCSTGLDESLATCHGADACTNVTCANGGTCHGFSYQPGHSVAYYVCVCADGFIGQHCELRDGTVPYTSDAFNRIDEVGTVETTASYHSSSKKPVTSSEQTEITTEDFVASVLKDVDPTFATLNGSVDEDAEEDTVLTWQPHQPVDHQTTGADYFKEINLHSISKRAVDPTQLPEEKQDDPTNSRATIPDISKCYPNPCYNGVCTSLWEGFHCSCRPGYTGATCQTSTDACASQPCINGGTCSLSVGGSRPYTCRCRPGFTSRQCEVLIDECASNPCQNGATCEDREAGFDCKCAAGYAGVQCERNINECASSPCYVLEGGRCVDEIDGFRCECPPSRAGQYCERRQQCGQDPCLNHGICFPASVGRPTSCQCLPGFTGVFCETNVNECVGNTCENGRCEDGVLGYSCVCNEGYTGSRCETRLDPCDPSPCQNNGYCCRSGKSWCAALLPIWYFECYCTNGFTGTHCERLPDPCNPDPCKNGGLCNNVGQGYLCTCPLNFIGTNCDNPVPCSSQPCLHGGSCTDLGDGQFRCDCTSQRYGTYCENTVPCLNQPCQNGGQCVNRDQGYTCLCQSGYVGTNCETYSACSPSPCQNNGVCVPSTFTTGFTCSCSANYTGSLCERYLACSAQPCRNGGTCIADVNGYQCQCPVGFTGRNCNAIAACATLPCLNGGTCLTVGDSFVCNCMTGFTGTECQTYVPCASSPCSNGGTCNNVGSTYVCSCPSQYTGPQCTVFRSCAVNPCLNSGTCVPNNAQNTFQCLCTPAYSGSRCEIFRPCTSKPCLNQGTCVELADGRYQCQCTSFFTGPACEIPIQCFPNPCLNNGKCSVQNNQIQCSCVAPFLGQRCEMRDTCATQPCQNGGYCVNLDTNYRCLCSFAYTGANCETLLACSSQPCLNNGECRETVNESYECVCSAMYGGRNCENYVPCGSNPCMNGGECFDQGLNYQCRCQSHYVGVNCQTALPCASNPCLMGVCINDINTYRCECDARYTGRNCDVPLVCDSSTCLNGQCQLVNNVGTCVCFSGYTGSNCDTRLPQCPSTCTAPCQCVALGTGGFTCQCPPTPTPTPAPTPTPTPQGCDNYPCYNGGTCAQIGDQLACLCVLPYTGARCEKRAGACDTRPCLNGGRCLEDGLAYSCVCQPPWAGDLCEREILSCSERPCQNGGTCQMDSLGVFCYCPRAYDGLFCQLREGVCNPNPCYNGGQCWQGDGNAVCDCPSGYEGSRCETSVQGCFPNPCNLGNCVENSQGKFQCSCPPEWVGVRCQTPNPCLSQPCRNSGTCLGTDSGFTCACPVGYSGPTCDGQLPKCASRPCFNLGTCVENPLAPLGFLCLCAPGYSGGQCELDIDECLQGGPKCANGGTCRDLVNGYRCDCLPGYSGPRCTVRDNCATQPCGTAATCLNTPNPAYGLDYTCLCQPGYEGPNCQQFQYCTTLPCLNGGTCNNQALGFSCVCEPGYTGTRCEQQILACNGVTCNNRGTCVPQGSFSYRCQCQAGYVGQDCESSSCAEEPCGSGGVCLTQGPWGFTCRCPGARGGDTCQLDMTTVRPQFSGFSYVKFPSAGGLSTRTAIELRFRPTRGDGLLLYAGHLDIDNGDFMALGLEEQAPVLRLNLGAGVLTLRGPAVPLNQWHILRVTRVERDTEMMVNEITVRDSSPEGSVGLTLENGVWVGGVGNVSEDINPRAGFVTAFQGCIHDVKVGQARPALLPWSSVTETQDVTKCPSDPCTDAGCRNDGRCVMSGGTFQCLCPVRFGGRDCATPIAAPATPLFNVDGYLTQSIQPLSGDELFISVSFRSTAPDGIVMYSAKDNDFFSLFLTDSVLNFAFDLGSGSATLTSISQVTLSTWQRVEIVRNGQRAQMTFESDEPVVRNSGGDNVGLDVGGRNWIGGVPPEVEIRAEVTKAVGFTGCIKDLTIQGTAVDLSQATEGHGVSSCTIPVCDGHQCTSGATCQPATTARGYECVCPPGRTGTFCEASQCTTGTQCRNGGQCVANSAGGTECLCTYKWKGPSCADELRFTIAAFKSNGYLAFPNEDFIGFQFVEFQLVFRTAMNEGLLIWMGNITGEYLMVAVINSRVEVRTDLGGGTGSVAATLENVSTNEWFMIQVILSGPHISLEVTDGMSGGTSSYFGRAPGSDKQLSVGSAPFYLGGLPEDVTTATNGMLGQGLNGCVLQLSAANLPQQFKQLRLQDDASDGAGITACEIE